jgi:hypothetical protein
VHDVPAEETMVGVPARKTSKGSKKHEDEFAAYATNHGDIIDPNKRDIELLKKELAQLKSSLATKEVKKKTPAKRKTKTKGAA